MKYDLHSHSTSSDGSLSPEELVTRAKEKGVDFFALTDHDTISGISDASKQANELGLGFITGVEISTQWREYNIHIVGLNFDPDNSTLSKGLLNQKEARWNRYHKTLEILAVDKIEDPHKQILEFAGDAVPGRPNYARFLVENGHCESYSEAYKYLSPNGKYYVNPGWEYMSYAVNWITKAGGIAVLAHPDKYGVGKPGLKAFLRDFKIAGGQAIEVCYGAGSKAAMSKAAHLAREYDLYGSVGSDFHRPGAPGIELGRVNPLPRNVKPIWEKFND